MKSYIVLLLIGLVSITGLFSTDYYKGVIAWDASGYYVYLPAVFIHHDLAKLSFFETSESGDPAWSGIHPDTATGNRYTKYPAGVAVMEMPFFLTAYAYATITHYPLDRGYSLPFKFAVCLAGIFWTLLGLFYLRKFLLRYFKDGVVALSIFLFFFGTNLLCYTVFSCGMSHPFSFGLFCMLLYCNSRWWETGKGKYVAVLGVLLGLITIVRPTNAIVAIIPLLWSTDAISTLRDRLRFFRSQVPALSIGAVLCLAIVMIQLFYWHYITGHWIIYSYAGESFDFSHPHIIDGLTDYNKGWLPYTPLGFLFLAGLIPTRIYYPRFFLPVIAFTALNIYIVFSWHFWPYGGGFGARALIESYAILAIPLAALMVWAANKWDRRVQWVGWIVLLLIVALNLFQTYQNKTGIMPGIWINKSMYWKLFGRLTPLE